MEGPGGRRGCRGHGCGRRAGAATPTHSPSLASSSSDEARCFEFILRIDEDPLGIKRLQDKFASSSTVPSRPSCSCGRPHAAFAGVPSRSCSTGKAIGWDKFAHAYNLEDGFLLTLIYEDDG
jgi:hypothetical protein